MAQERQARDSVVGDIDPALMQQYESARTACGGVGVSPLVDKRCGGCRLLLSAVDIDRIRKLPVDALTWCDCGRILVRE